MTQSRLVWLFCALIWAFLTLPVGAQVPQPAAVPDDLPDPPRSQLLQRRAGLLSQRDALRIKVDGHNQKCRSVPERSPTAAECSQAMGQLQREIATYSDGVKNFNQEVDRARGSSTGTFAIQGVEFRGEFYILTSDGRKLIGRNAAQVPINNEAKLIIGPNSYARLTLPDDTTFTAECPSAVGRNCEMVLDEFVYEPQVGFKKLTVRVIKGVFRWVTGKVESSIPKKLEIHCCSGAIRGTDFETSVAADGSGYIKLFQGVLEITEKKTGRAFMMHGGEMIGFDADGTVGRPAPMKP